MATNYRDKIKKSTDFRFNVKRPNGMKKHIFVLLSAVLLGGMCGCVQKSSSAHI